MNEKISEIVAFARKHSSKPTEVYDLGNKKYYRIQDGFFMERDPLKANTLTQVTNLHSGIVKELMLCELEDPGLYDAVFGKGSGDAVEKLFGAGYSEMGRWCLEFKKHLEANPDTFKDSSKVIVIDSVSPDQRGKDGN